MSDCRGAPHPFKITADHPILTESPSGEQVSVHAKALVEMHASGGARVSDGERFWPVERAELVTESVSVVQVTFTDADAAALTWLLPKARPHAGPRELWDRAAVVCRGSPPTAASAEQRDERRCLSEGGRR